ncbi:UNVERIFIED_CONTAM: hypothetical protein Sangu_3017900 [Sesamum angustifolium]|uniref:Uncharacterized protein n=1 Tax=Sesamum angustifolium TaxID=2727405 RepID=A0AAW2KMK5_9LAMI
MVGQYETTIEESTPSVLDREALTREPGVDLVADEHGRIATSTLSAPAAPLGKSKGNRRWFDSQK